MGLRFLWPYCRSARMARRLRCWSWVVVMRIWPLPSYTGWVDGSSILGSVGSVDCWVDVKAIQAALDDSGKGFIRCSSIMTMMLSSLCLQPGAWDFSGCLKSFSATRRIHFGSLSSVGCRISFPKLIVKRTDWDSLHIFSSKFRFIWRNPFETGQGWPFPCRGWPCHGGSTPRPGAVEHPPGPAFPDVAGGLRCGQRYRGAPVGRRQQGEEVMRGYEGFP